MHGIPFVGDLRSKGAYQCFTLRTDSFHRYQYGRGNRIPAMENSENQNSLQFLNCKNYTMGGAGLIGVISTISFDKVPINAYFNEHLAVVQGVMNKEVPMIMYHLLVGLPDGETRSISAIISKFTSPIQFAQKYFDPKPLYLPLDECNIDF